MDWKRLRTSITGAPSHRRRWQSFVPALSTIYSTKVSPENCKAWAEKYPDMMPLLVAVRKVETVHRDARGVKGNSKARKDFYEIVACRKLMSDIGTQRISSNKELKAKNRAAGEKEMELVKKIARMDKTSMPSDRDSAEKKFEARDIAWKKLTRIRTARVTDVATVRRQNVELGALEAAVKARITALQERLEKEARGGSSSKSSRK